MSRMCLVTVATLLSRRSNRRTATVRLPGVYFCYFGNYLDGLAFGTAN